MSDVFISYSSENSDVAERIAEDIKQFGLSVFYDKELMPGENWDTRLAQELKRAKYILVLLSPSYVNSQWARKELEVAALSESEGGPRIIPILVQNTEIPPFLRTKQYADLRENYEAALARVKQALTTKPEPSQEVRARRSRKIFDLLGVLVSLLGAATSAIITAVFEKTTIMKVDSSIVVIVIFAVFGLTTLVAIISAYRPYRRSKPIEIVARAVERAYVSALEDSEMNPLRVREVNHG